MGICCEKGCKAPTIPPRRRCEPHREAHEQEVIRRSNQKAALKLQAKRAADPCKCKAEGCSNPLARPRDKLCPACKAKRAERKCVDCGKPVGPKLMRCEQCKRLHGLAERSRRIEPEPAPKPKAKPYKPPISEAEQRKLDKELKEKEDAAYHAALGFVPRKGRPLASPVRKLTRAEIAALEAQYQPPQAPERLPMAVYFERRNSGAELNGYN